MKLNGQIKAFTLIELLVVVAIIVTDLINLDLAKIISVDFIE